MSIRTTIIKYLKRGNVNKREKIGTLQFESGMAWQCTVPLPVPGSGSRGNILTHFKTSTITIEHHI
jgi:hypothetical protein